MGSIAAPYLSNGTSLAACRINIELSWILLLDSSVNRTLYFCSLLTKGNTGSGSMSIFFKGPWLHWTALLIVFFIFSVMGFYGLHIREFSIFLLIVLLVSLGIVLLVGLSYRQDYRQ